MTYIKSPRGDDRCWMQLDADAAINETKHRNAVLVATFSKTSGDVWSPAGTETSYRCCRECYWALIDLMTHDGREHVRTT